MKGKGRKGKEKKGKERKGVRVWGGMALRQDNENSKRRKTSRATWTSNSLTAATNAMLPSNCTLDSSAVISPRCVLATLRCFKCAASSV